MALSGSVTVVATPYDDLIFTWAATQSVSDNTSTVAWSLKLAAGSWGQIVATPGSPWKVTLAGQEFSGTTSIAVENNQTKVLASGTALVAHEADGSGSFDFTFQQTFHITFGGEYVSVVSGEGTAVLDTIARASGITAPDTGELGQQVVIAIDAAADFTHTLTYTFGGASGVIAENAVGEALWTPSITLASQIPNDVSGTAVILCATYSGSTKIGETQRTLTLTVPEGVVPGVTAQVSDASGAFDTLGVFVQNVTKLAVATEAKGVYGSTVTGVAVTLGGKTYTGGTVTDSGTLALVVTVTDSRGRQGVFQTDITFEPYAPPRLSLAASRCLADGTADDTGEYAKVTISGFVTQVNSRNTAALVLSYGSASENIDAAVGTVSVQRIIPANSNTTLQIQAALSDALLTATRQLTLSTGYATLDLLSGGKGIAFGKTATREGFDCAMHGYFSGGLTVEQAVDGETEYLCPPMELGVEYRTMERFNGKPVYTKLVDCGTLAEGVNAIKYYDTIYAYAFRACGKLFDSGVVRTLPYVSAELPSANQCHLIVGAGNIRLYCGSNHAGKKAQAQVWYTKKN